MSMNVLPVNTTTKVISRFASNNPETAKAIQFIKEVMPQNVNKNSVKNFSLELLNNLANTAKNKPKENRNFIDYAIMLANQLANIDPRIYN